MYEDGKTTSPPTAQMQKMTDLERARKQYVVKRNDMIQKSKKTLSLVENKAVNYIFSKVKPGDTPDTIYRFDCQEFYKLMRWRRDSYAFVRQILISIAGKTWSVIDEDGTERVVHWFNTLHLKKDTKGNVISESKLPGRYVEIKIHEDMMHYIFGLEQQRNKNGIYYSGYPYDNTSLFSHTYSSALYELCKSYENLGRWVFEYSTGTENDIQLRVATYKQENIKGSRTGTVFTPIIPKSWSRFTYFDRDVLKCAVAEINMYSDLNVSYEPLKQLHGVKTRRYSSVVFYIKRKNKNEMIISERAKDDAYREFDDQLQARQMTISDFIDMLDPEEEKNRIIDRAKYKIAASCLYDDFTQEEIENLVEEALKHIIPGHVDVANRELWAVDYITYYQDKQASTRKSTRTTPYRRLLESVKKDYDGHAEIMTGYGGVCEKEVQQAEEVYIPQDEDKYTQEPGRTESFVPRPPVAEAGYVEIVSGRTETGNTYEDETDAQDAQVIEGSYTAAEIDDMSVEALDAEIERLEKLKRLKKIKTLKREINDH